MIQIQDVRTALNRIQGYIHRTSLEHTEWFSGLAGSDVYVKVENLQKTGSFKIRGALNKMMSLRDEDRQRGIIAASAGNHAQGVAYAAKQSGTDCTIIMPSDASLSKIEATQRYGADVELYGQHFDEALANARERQQKKGHVFVHPFDDPAIIAGQGTIGLEILQDLPDVEALICPVGGGGLISGIAFTLKSLRPDIKIYGVRAKPEQELADGIAVKQYGLITKRMIGRYVDRMVEVDDHEIAGLFFQSWKGVNIWWRGLEQLRWQRW